MNREERERYWEGSRRRWAEIRRAGEDEVRFFVWTYFWIAAALLVAFGAMVVWSTFFA